MSDEPDEAQKTEDPTPKRLSESRKKGQVALSREVNNLVMLLAGTLVVAIIVPHLAMELLGFMRSYIEMAHKVPVSKSTDVGTVLSTTFAELTRVLFLPFLLFLAAAILGPFLQIGPLLSFESMKPDLSKISIIKGFGRLFSMRSLVDFLKGICKIALVGVVGAIIVYPYFGRVGELITMPIDEVMRELLGLIISMMIGILIVMFVIAMIDLVYQQMEHMKKMRMTKQEIKDEHKQSEGDPHVKGKLRQLRMEKSRQRMMQAVPEADVVITNPTHFAIALKYDTEISEAPICVAKGMDDLALRIREVATEHGVTIQENKPLARALYDTVEVDEMIPVEHYKAVAEIISYVYKIKGRKGKTPGG